jgi:anti-anti-sigma factor
MSNEAPQLVSCESIGGTVVVEVLTSKLRDTDVSYAVRDQILTQLTATPTSQLVIDLGQVEFIGSIGFLAFLSARRQLAGGRVVFCQVSPYVLEAFKACGLVSNDPNRPGVFEVQPSRSAALESLGG